MLDRTVQPELKEIDKIDFVAPAKHAINAYVNLFHMKNVTDETTRLDLYFDAGKCRGVNGIPGFVNGLLLSGTLDKTSVQINSEINSLGGFYEAGISSENSVITIYCLRENVMSIFETLIDAITNVAFIEKEVNEFLAERKQRFDVNLEKVSGLAQREFQQQLFASNSDYSKVVMAEDFEQVDLNELKAFHAENYLSGLSKAVVVGNLDNMIVQKIIDGCAKLTKEDSPFFRGDLQHSSGLNSNEKEGAIQTAIRVGRILFNKNNEDYLDFLVLNTILGDYFGSRLMSNIREDKGYTYGIGTIVSELTETGYFMTATEVRKDVRDETLKEIKHEYERLQHELVSDEELELVKNYMLGQLLKSADGPYAMTDLFLSAEMHGKGLDFYNEAIASIHGITPQRIQDLAKKYLNWGDMSIVAYG